MRYAITPKGIAKLPGARAIEDHWPLTASETFTVTEAGYNPAFVLAENETSLRAQTPEEITAGADAESKTELLDSLKAAAIEALIDQSLEIEAAKPGAPQAVKDWAAELAKG